MTDKTVIATGLPDASLAAIGANAVAASNDAVAAEGHGGAAPSAPCAVGDLLRTTRETQGLSAGDIAAKLRMGLKQVVALEAADFAALPTGTFLRGFVRNYAKAVGLNSDEVLALLEKSHGSAAPVKATPVVVPTQQNISMPSPGGELATPKARMLAAALVVLLLCGAFLYWWEYVRPHLGEGGRARTSVSEQLVRAPAVSPVVETAAVKADSAAVAPELKAPAPADGTPQAADSAGATSAVPQLPVPATPPASVPLSSQSPAPAPATAVITTAATPADKPAAVPAAKGGGVLGFTFRGDSWVEVVDGGGKTILSKRFSAGEAEELNGRLPFSVVIGNAQVTRMAFNGKEFDLVPHTRVSVARVTIK